MSLAIQITGTKERIEEIGKRMILAQCHMGGTAIFSSETMLLYMPDDGDGVGQACDDLVKYDVYDPIQDNAVLVEADGTPGFVAGYQHGFVACSKLRQESVDALQRALTDAEQTLLDREELISSLRAANAELTTLRIGQAALLRAERNKALRDAVTVAHRKRGDGDTPEAILAMIEPEGK